MNPTERKKIAATHAVPTFGDLVAAICDSTDSDAERVVALTDLFDSGKCRFLGHYEGSKIIWTVPKSLAVAATGRTVQRKAA